MRSEVDRLKERFAFEMSKKERGAFDPGPGPILTEHDTMAILAAVLIGVAFIAIGVLLYVRLYNKAGADIQNPIELRRLAIANEFIAGELRHQTLLQERIADALERESR